MLSSFPLSVARSSAPTEDTLRSQGRDDQTALSDNTTSKGREKTTQVINPAIKTDALYILYITPFIFFNKTIFCQNIETVHYRHISLHIFHNLMLTINWYFFSHQQLIFPFQSPIFIVSDMWDINKTKCEKWC